MSRAILLFAGTWALLAEAPQPVKWTLAPVNVKSIKPGARLQVRLRAKIDAGWHLYAESQEERGPNALRIWLAEDQPFSLAAEVKAPRPFSSQDPNFGMRVKYYQGEAEFVLPVLVKAGGANSRSLRVNSYYQVCNEQTCLPPKTQTLEMPLSPATP